MTEKRFKFTAFDCAYITDHQKHKDYPFVDEPEYIQDIVDLLNELHKENQQLKNTLSEIEKIVSKLEVEKIADMLGVDLK